MTKHTKSQPDPGIAVDADGAGSEAGGDRQAPSPAIVSTAFSHDTLLRPAAAANVLGVSLSQFYKTAATHPEFPKALAISTNVRAYWVSELLAWAKSRPRVSGPGEPYCLSQRANLEKSRHRRRAA